VSRLRDLVYRNFVVGALEEHLNAQLDQLVSTLVCLEADARSGHESGTMAWQQG
jgi:hypothetical protein